MFLNTMDSVVTAEKASLEQRSAELIGELELFPDREELFHYIINAGRSYPAMPEEYRTDDRLLPGCISRLWIQGAREGAQLIFHMDADAMISKGLASLLLGFYNGHHPEAVLAVEPTFLTDSGLIKMVSGNRSNSLSYLREYVKKYAISVLS